jgi:hypothetical protein
VTLRDAWSPEKAHREAREANIPLYQQRAEAGLPLTEDEPSAAHSEKPRRSYIECISCGATVNCNQPEFKRWLSRKVPYGAGSVCICPKCLDQWGIPPLWAIPIIHKEDL